MDTRSHATRSTNSTATSSCSGNTTLSSMENRIRARTGNHIKNELWLSNVSVKDNATLSCLISNEIDKLASQQFLEEQEKRRMSFQNKKSIDLNKRLRQRRKDLNNKTGSIERYYRQRRHVQRRDSKVGSKLRKLLRRRQNHYANAEKELNIPPSINFVPPISEDGPTIEFKDGWIDLQGNGLPEKQTSGRSFLEIIREPKNKNNLSEGINMDDSLCGSMLSLAISIQKPQRRKDEPKKQRDKQKVQRDEPKKQRDEPRMKPKVFEDDTQRSKSVETLLTRESSTKIFIKRKSVTVNERLDNGAFSFSLW